MSELTANNFRAFFEALWDKTPFAWQQVLAERVVSNTTAPWPQAIALPTAAGKTACIDIAVFALATQACRLAKGESISAPRRIFFVVDRRLIVDEAYDRSKQIAAKLSHADSGVLKVVADALRIIATGGGDDEGPKAPLTVHTLRGGMYRSESWARNPLQPAVIASTVDQLGSRLLFRAYGRGPGMWPVFAGLAANDSLILLDEAHCAQPFLQTLQAVHRYRAWAEQPLQRCFHPVVLSATPPSGVEPFVDDSDEPRNPQHPLGRRQLAHKPASLAAATNARGAKATENLAKALAKAAESLVSEQRRAVVIFVNRVATARATYRLLRSKHGEQVSLLTGRMRAVDKDAVVAERLKSLASATSVNRKLDEPHFVVATQTLEVGADLDFDALVSECASLDALRQRFGRLNRMGRAIDAQAKILIRGDQVDGTDDDPVYGEALANTWAWLQQQKGEAGAVDFGIAHLASRLPVGDALQAPVHNAPVMLPAHIDCWAQTAPQPIPSPDVALFLHGPREGAADVQMCWRVDLDLDSLSLCPPTGGETLPVPVGVFRRWLAGTLNEDASSDVEGADADTSDVEQKNPCERVLRWQGAKTNADDFVAHPGDIRPGDIVVIPSSASASITLGDFPAADDDIGPNLDVGDRAYLSARAKAQLRLHPELILRWPDGDAQNKARALLDLTDDDPNKLLAATRDLLQTLERETENYPAFHWLHTAASRLYLESRRKTFIRNIRRTGSGYLVLTGQTLIEDLTRQAETFNDEDDASASGTSNRQGQAIKLHDHLPGVETFARRFGKGCGLADELVEALARAGLLHDLGKADPRFQALLQGGNRLAIAPSPLAKSAALPKSRVAFEIARQASGYPRGGRHELLSVRLAESAPALLPDDPDLRDLVLHLVASHHGHCRPFAPVVVDAQAPEVTFELAGQQLDWRGPTELERLDSGVAQRYWRLTHRYGWWGLAWLESLLRLADHRRSEWEQTHASEETS